MGACSPSSAACSSASSPRRALRPRTIPSARSRSSASTRSLSLPVSMESSPRSGRRRGSPVRGSVGCARMSPVAAVTDTTAYLPENVLGANNIYVVSLYVNFGGERTERESDISDYGRFFEELRRAEQLPTTSQPAVGDFLEVYEPLLEQGQDIVS